jgi:hypothetical protein
MHSRYFSVKLHLLYVYKLFKKKCSIANHYVVSQSLGHEVRGLKKMEASPPFHRSESGAVRIIVMSVDLIR